MRFFNCTVQRRALTKHHTLDLKSGVMTYSHSTWEKKECGTPLFSPEEKESGVCKSCLKGFVHEENYPLEDAKEVAERNKARKPECSNCSKPLTGKRAERAVYKVSICRACENLDG